MISIIFVNIFKEAPCAPSRPWIAVTLALFQEPPHVLGLEVEVVRVRLRPQLHFLDLDDRLLLARVFLSARLHVLVLPEVHDPAHRGHRLRGHFDEIHLALSRELQRLRDGQDPQLLAVRADHADFPNANPLVDPDLLGLYGRGS